MKREKKGMRRERIILVASSAFVLAALTMTGIYMRKNEETKEEDYLAKLQSVEESTIEALDQAAKENLGSMTDQNSFNALFENDMDFMPLEEEISVTGSGTVEMGTQKGITDPIDKTAQNPVGNDKIQAEEIIKTQTVGGEALNAGAVNEEVISGQPVSEEITVSEPVNEEITGGESVDGELISDIIPVMEETPQKVLIFEEELVRPVNGSVLIPYNMSASVYFPTLAHYAYNPAQIISAKQGEEVLACADGQVKEILRDPKLGEVLKLDLGDGYEAVYGQLCNISVAVGDYVSAGEVIAKVQNPTYFYSAEGCNLYFELKADNEPVNPEAYYAGKSVLQ